MDRNLVGIIGAGRLGQAMARTARRAWRDVVIAQQSRPGVAVCLDQTGAIPNLTCGSLVDVYDGPLGAGLAADVVLAQAFEELGDHAQLRLAKAGGEELLDLRKMAPRRLVQFRQARIGEDGVDDSAGRSRLPRDRRAVV